MEGQKNPTAILSPSHLELVDYVLRTHTAPSTLIICSTRKSFLEELHGDVRNNHPTERLLSQDNDSSATPHSLLIPTIHLLSKSRTICLAFTPTLQHLRAYLATFQPSAEIHPTPPKYQKPGSRISMLLILGLVALHHSTAEHSAQGLSQSLAVAVEAAYFSDRKLILAEIHREGGREEITAEDEDMIEVQYDPWTDQVPLLNGSIRSGIEGRTWAGRTVDIRRVVGRWCKFESLDAEDPTI